MKTIALLSSILLFASCGSSTDFAHPDIQCSPGQEVGIEAGLQTPRPTGAELSNERDVQLLVQVSNNSHHDFTVARVRVEQLYREDAPYAFDDVYREVNVTIPEGEDHLFELPTSGRWTAMADRDPMSVRSSSLSLAATVELASGEKYHCRYSVPVPR
jgi:hypothetical protein